MGQGLILALGLAGVLLWATSATARGGFFFGASVGVPVHSGLVATPSFVAVLPSGFVPPASLVLTPHVVIEPRTAVVVTIVPAKGFPQPVVLAPSARAASPILAPAPP
jgi:hypothetical protein